MTIQPRVIRIQDSRWRGPFQPGFSRERQRLAALDFHIVSLKIRRMLAESKNQLVFERGRPLNHGAIIIPWQAAA